MTQPKMFHEPPVEDHCHRQYVKTYNYIIMSVDIYVKMVKYFLLIQL